MLVLERFEGQWVEITHTSGDVLRVRLTRIQTDPPKARLIFSDPARNFQINRAEKVAAREGWIK